MQPLEAGHPVVSVFLAQGPNAVAGVGAGPAPSFALPVSCFWVSLDINDKAPALELIFLSLLLQSAFQEA